MNQQILSQGKLGARLPGLTAAELPAAPGNTPGNGTETARPRIDRLIGNSTMRWPGAHNDGR